MGVSKVVLNGNVLVDLTGVTVEASNLVSPNTAIGADGEDVTGSLQAKTSSDLTVSGATVTAPAGVYSTDASKSVASGSATTPATTITANPSISVSSSGLITASNSKTQSVTPTVSAGYVSSGTAGTITVSGSNTSQLTTQAAQTIYPSTSDQTISSGKYLTGAQTVKGVLLTNLTAANIANGVTVKVGDSADDDRITSVTGTYEGGGGVTPAEQKDVNFIDYDGAILYSYTAAEFAQLSALPANPTHTGLTAQGWNWSLSNAKTYVATYGKLWIGQMYVTSDGKTRIYIHLEKGRLSPYLGIAVNGTATVEWGDGSSNSTVTGTDTSTVINTQHNYAAAGDYMIAISVSGSMALAGSSSYGSQVLYKNNTTSSGGQNRVYQGAVRKVEVGANTRINSYAFQYCANLAAITIPSGVTDISSYAFVHCYSLAAITIPSEVTSIGDHAFYYCYSLDSITIPSGVTDISSYAFANCYSLANITIPSGVTSIVNSVFYYCYSLDSIIIPSGVTSIDGSAFYYCVNLAAITIPSGVTSIGSNAFFYCYGLGEIHFKPTAPPTVSNRNAWTGLPTDCIIYVPSGKKSAYTSASNYPYSTTYTYVEE